MLAALATADGSFFTPVQLQKLFFLIQRNLGEVIDGPFFDFKPYDYGPFDPTVYNELNRMEQEDLVEIELVADQRRRRYRLTCEGIEKGKAALASLPSPVVDYLGELTRWVRSQTFAQLVSAIYRSYPEMKVASVFRE